ncbi:hypothetical protein PC116_g10382 [Phytophthora cactorum]|uniref:Uncharacterized protein n=1 Tax=Phytophthora cactorum TaxID=29920 RepID=A0A8T1BSQ6_9STRA|nr:hypothetical protein PC112_g18448 [Phytophthora cactorum]KAG2833177.1 hypothetical protein PC111_g6295 [Phytophthora cactorum]KAG2909442.1 hypothetical protein PC117_g19646 [Phytophthora cactorum]KAG4241685.1 hypothetical protein PC116_g10382 [Phytophthora cactorum]
MEAVDGEERGRGRSPAGLAVLVPASAMGGEGRGHPDQAGRGGASDDCGRSRRDGAVRGGGQGRHDKARAADTVENDA